MEKVDILGISFDNITKGEAVEKAVKLLEGRGSAYVVTPNTEIALIAMENKEYLNCLNGADIVLPDGIGIIKAAKILKTPLKEKVAGIEFAQALLDELDKSGKKLFLLGGKPGVADMAAGNLSKKYPGIIICGTNDGYFENEDEVIAKINEKRADVLFVCLGAPKQELFMFRNKDKLNVGLTVGLGGSIDVFANRAKRAPKIFLNLGLEWLYRLIRQPSRIKRQYKLFGFLFKVYSYKRKKEREAVE